MNHSTLFSGSRPHGDVDRDDHEAANVPFDPPIETSFPEHERASATPQRTDGWLVGALGVLILVGLVIFYSASSKDSYKFFNDGAYFLKRQVLWVLIGLGAAGVMAGLDYRLWRRHSVLLLAGTVGLLVAVLAVGSTVLGGERWLIGGSIQPSEATKLTMVIYLADWMSSKRDKLRDVSLGLLPFGIVIGLVCGLIVLEHSFSVAILVGVVATVMFFAAGADLVQMLVSGVVSTAMLLVLIVATPYSQSRVQMFLDPSADPLGGGYQVLAALRTVSGGGWFGVGLGQGGHKLSLPLAHSDAIFAVVGEETGVVGSLLLVGLFGIVIWRGYRVAAGSRDRFASLLAIGVTTWFAAQTLLHIATVTKLVPPTGVPLPFVSYGGSSMVSCLAAAGLLVNLSRRVDPQKANLSAHLDLRRGDRRTRLSRAYRAGRLGRPGPSGLARHGR